MTIKFVPSSLGFYAERLLEQSEQAQCHGDTYRGQLAPGLRSALSEYVPILREQIEQNKEPRDSNLSERFLEKHGRLRDQVDKAAKRIKGRSIFRI